MAIGGREFLVSASIGVAMFDGHPDHQYLIKRADEAMYADKALHRRAAAQG